MGSYKCNSVAIVGAGIQGVCNGLFLQKSGQREFSLKFSPGKTSEPRSMKRPRGVGIACHRRMLRQCLVIAGPDAPADHLVLVPMEPLLRG